jgi:cycloeucalenol cycloisomerase
MDIATSMSVMDIATSMSVILGTMLAFLGGLVLLQKPKPNADVASLYLASVQTEPSKRAYELFVAAYTPLWIGVFAVVVASHMYERFTAWNYLQLCGGLSLPFLLQPILLPTAGFGSPDAKRPLFQRYAFKANVWLAIYSFIGNYWYTHYFYSVLKAAYTMPSHRLNNVPIAMYFATHFYFSTYHLLSNMLLRKVVTTFEEGLWRSTLFISVVLVFSYFTAFMETLSISEYPYYTFEDRNMAYTVGSAFYGIYFLVSFPAFFAFDVHIDDSDPLTSKQMTLWRTVVSSCGYGMMILTLLDFVRLYLDVPLIVGALKELQA